MPHVLLGRGSAAPCTGCEAPCGVNSRGCVVKFRIPYDKCITRVHYSHFQYPYSQCQCQLFAAPVRLLGIMNTRVARIFQYHTSFLCRPRFLALPCAVSFAVASQPAHICAGTAPHLRPDCTRFSYCAMSCLALLKRLDAIDTKAARVVVLPRRGPRCDAEPPFHLDRIGRALWCAPSIAVVAVVSHGCVVARCSSVARRTRCATLGQAALAPLT